MTQTSKTHTRKRRQQGWSKRARRKARIARRPVDQVALEKSKAESARYLAQLIKDLEAVPGPGIVGSPDGDRVTPVPPEILKELPRLIEEELGEGTVGSPDGEPQLTVACSLK